VEVNRTITPVSERANIFETNDRSIFVFYEEHFSVSPFIYCRSITPFRRALTCLYGPYHGKILIALLRN
jgi:hypothetical protein